jgi:hypothetical protein
MRPVLAVLEVLLLTGASPADAPEAPGVRMFERLKTGSGNLRVSYYLTGGGSAVVENLVMGGVPTMTTVYHLDGSDLRMTHYCAARNQPRLRAVRFDEAQGSAEFAFVDVTGVGPKNPGHVEAFFVRLLDADRLNLRFTFGGGPGKTAVENILVRRINPS